MRTFFTFLLTVLLITGFGGCDRCHELPYVDINRMYVGIRSMQGGNHITNSHPIAYDSLVIEARFDGSHYGKLAEPASFSVLPSAYASEDCDDGLGGSKETIESISIIAINNFDNEFLVGDTINSIVNVIEPFYGSLKNPSSQPLTVYLANIQPGISAGYFGTGLNFILTRKPTEKIVQFRVAVNLTNGEKYTGETIPITIKQ